MSRRSAGPRGTRRAANVVMGAWLIAVTALASIGACSRTASSMFLPRTAQAQARPHVPIPDTARRVRQPSARVERTSATGKRLRKLVSAVRRVIPASLPLLPARIAAIAEILADPESASSDAPRFALPVAHAVTGNATLSNSVAVSAESPRFPLPGQTDSIAFVIRNTGTNAGTFDISNGWNTSGCVLYNHRSANSVTLQPRDTAIVYVAFTTCTGTPQADWISLGAYLSTDASVNAVATVNAYATTYGVRVTPRTGAAYVRPGATRKGTVTFTVTNLGTATETYNISNGWTGCASYVGRSADTLRIAGGASATVTDTIRVSSGSGSCGTFSIAATARDNASVQDVANLAVVGTAIAAATDSVNPGAARLRSECVTLPAGLDGTYQCGDLLLSHALPAVRTMGVDRAPVLVYNSQTARPFPLIAADVVVPDASGLDSVTARLVLYGSSNPASADTMVERFRWAGSDWTSGSTRRVVVGFEAYRNGWSSTGLYGYDVVFTAWLAGESPQTWTAGGELAFVNNYSSVYGAGWFPAGLERLLPIGATVHDTTTYREMVVQADGSTRIYRYVAGTNYYIGLNPDRPDTLFLNGSVYSRNLPDGGVVSYNGAGQHTSTVNRLGHTTSFAYNTTTGGLATITVPQLSTPYTFSYSGGVLQSVTAPGSRVTTFSISSSPRYMDMIIDPDGDTTVFNHFAPRERVSLVIDRAGQWQRFLYDSAGTLTTAIIDSAPATYTALATTTYCAGEVRGLNVVYGGVAQGGCAMSAQPLTAVQTKYDGPRTTVGDSTLFALNRFGAPSRITDAFGATTVLTRGDARWPTLVTGMVQPNGFTTKAFFNGRALMDSSVAINPLGDSRNAVTRYEWDAHWRSPTKITTAEGVVTTFAYDATTGNRLWVKPGDKDSLKVTFTYFDASGESHLPKSVIGAMGDTLRFHLDAKGNVDSVRTPLGYATSTLHDALGRDSLITRVIDSNRGLTSTVLRLYDVIGRDSVQVQRGSSTATYNSGTVPADSIRVTYSFNPVGLPDGTTRKFWRGGASHTLSDSRTFDAARRVTLQYPSVGGARTFYRDAAGNDTLVVTARSHAIRSSFDALNRVTRRVVPSVSYSSVSCGSIPLFFDNNITCTGFSIPTRGSSVCFPVDTATFAYDTVTGAMLRADNRYARVRRSYLRNGALDKDTLQIRTYYRSSAETCDPASGDTTWTGSDFGTHSYVIAHGYDLDGRAASLTPPSGIVGCPSTTCVPQTYNYNPLTGALGGIRGVDSTTFSFRYDRNGQLRATVYPSGFTDSSGVDLDGRVESRALLKNGTVMGYTATLDGEGRTTYASGTNPDATSFNQTTWYGPLGAVVAMDGSAGTELYDVDALGNRHWRSQLNVHPSGPDRDGIRKLFYVNPERIDSIGDTSDSTTTTPDYETGTKQAYDEAGNLRAKWTREVNRPQSSNRYEVEYSFYDADDRLRVFNRHLGWNQISNDVSGIRGVFEEYRYDALGRRILVRSRRTGPTTSSNRDGYVERTIWDGSQVLGEIRTFGRDTATVAEMESDTPTDYTGTAVHFGRVRYTHALGIDRPLAVHKQPASVSSIATVYPHDDWRGLYAAGSVPSGVLQRSCAGQDGCPVIDWAGGNTELDLGPRARTDASSWVGNLLSQGTDGSGLQFKRARYYDPQTGHFTQPDPIGLAGGMNHYGFAGGDPVTYSDPFGLCPDCILDAVAIAMDVVEMGSSGVTAGRVVGLALDVGGALLPGVPSPGGAKLAVKVGETAFTKAGRSAHKLWDAGEGFVKEFTLPSGRRADAVNFAKRIVKELKPDNAKAIRRGESQVAKYADELTKLTKETWKGVVETYTRNP